MTQKKLNCREISPPKWLSKPGQNHYRQLVKELTENGIFNPLEKGLIEMMAQLYADTRDPELPKKEQRESIKLYSRLIKIVGSRGGGGDEGPEAEEDLRKFMEEEG